MESHNNQKKIAVINDLTGFGRCALTVAVPVISVMGLACCPVPTAILSNHTAFPSSFIDDYTEKMEPYIEEWKKLGLVFDGIYSGFLGSKEQIAIVRRFFKNFSKEGTQIIIDPVMGDNGKTYRTYTPEMCQEMKKLVVLGDIVTPNVTEACILTDTPYKEHWTESGLYGLAVKLSALGPDSVIITGIELSDVSDGSHFVSGVPHSVSGSRLSVSDGQPCAGGEKTPGGYIGNYCFTRERGGQLIAVPCAGKSRCGTGDLFASIIAADAVNGVPLEASVKKASDFVAKSIRASNDREIPLTDGVCFEYFLGELGREAPCVTA